MLRLNPTDALIVVDVQNDFLPGGSLAVRDGDAVVPVLNRYLARFRAAGAQVTVTRDWHPRGHCSFVAQGGPWPEHCVAGTRGAEFAEMLELPADALIVSKADTADADAYSGFEDTGLAATLRGLGVTRVFIGGLATDYCVLNTVRDALTEGFETLLLTDAVRPVEAAPGDGVRAVEQMRSLGAIIITLEDIEP